MKVSIITISYNSENFIEKAIQSVLSQKNVDLEYILVDGDSTDGTVGIIKSHASCDARIKWVSEPDAGISDAMNKGIGMASGEILGHLHSDDFYPHDGVLEKVSTAFAKGAIWVTGGMQIVGVKDEVIADIEVRNFSYRELLRGNLIYHPSTFVARRGLESVGLFDTSLKFAMDYDLWLRLGKLAAPLRLEEPLSAFRAHRASLSTVSSGSAYDEAWSVRKRYYGINPVQWFLGYYRFLRHRRSYRRFNEELLAQGDR